MSGIKEAFSGQLSAISQMSEGQIVRLIADR
jgi:hypothetical protein